MSELYKHLYEMLSPITKSAEEYSLRLTEKYLDNVSLSAANVDELSETLGGNLQTAIFVKLAVCLASRHGVDSFKFGERHTSEEMREYFKSVFLPLSVETVYIMCLDSDKRVISCDFVGEGTVNQSTVLSRRMMEIALKRRAKYVITAHNHPNGNAEFSREDTEATSVLCELFRASGMALMGHYVIAGKESQEMKILPEC